MDDIFKQRWRVDAFPEGDLYVVADSSETVIIAADISNAEHEMGDRAVFDHIVQLHNASLDSGHASDLLEESENALRSAIDDAARCRDTKRKDSAK